MPDEIKLSQALNQRVDAILAQWLEIQFAADKMMPASDRQQATRFSRDFITELTAAANRGSLQDLNAPHWAPVKEILETLTADRANSRRQRQFAI